MIYLNKVSKRYDRTILNHVSHYFERGKIYVIKGVSGSGKTTLLNILGLVDNDYEGQYFIDGKQVNKKNTKQIEQLRSRIGYVYQDSLLISTLNVKDNLTFFSKDEREIQRWAEAFHITSLLDKRPEQLSNGERQRVALIRAIITNKDIIICDEPTASLDRAASMKIASEIEKLKSKGKIIIISTHEDVFDDLCDELIYLDYGVIKENKGNQDSQELTKQRKVKRKSFIKEDVKYSILQGKKNSGLLNVMLVIFFLILLISAGFRLHFEDSYREIVMQEYPYYTTTATEEYIQKYELVNEVVTYEDYHLDVNGDEYYPYLPYQDSSLRIPEAIKEGNFPQNDQEVLINYAYYKKHFEGMDIADVLKEEIVFPQNDQTFKISGVLSDEQDLLKIAYGHNPYYQPFLKGAEPPVVFLDYAFMEQNVEMTPQTNKLYAIKNIKDKELIEHLTTSSVFSSWDTIIESKMYTVNMITNIIFIMIAILSVIVFLFVYNVISLDLFYRRKEVGYLRLFSIGKKRLNFILKFSYFYKIAVPFIISILLYEGFVIFTKRYIEIGLTPIEISIISFVLLVYVAILIYFPIRKILKTDIKKLLNDEI